MKRIFCDRCKDEIKAHPIKVIFKTVDRESEDYVDSQVEINPDLSRVDLCRECAEHFAGAIARGRKLGVPAKENPGFKAAVEDMIAMSQADNSTKKGQQKKTRESSSRCWQGICTEKCRLVRKEDCGRDALLRCNNLQCHKGKRKVPGA